LHLERNILKKRERVPLLPCTSTPDKNAKGRKEKGTLTLGREVALLKGSNAGRKLSSSEKEKQASR